MDLEVINSAICLQGSIAESVKIAANTFIPAAL